MLFVSYNMHVYCVWCQLDPSTHPPHTVAAYLEGLRGFAQFFDDSW